MRLVLDQGIPRDAAAGLRGHGFDCLHAGKVGVSKATDEDADSTHSCRYASRGPSVIRLRLQGLGAAQAVELLQRVTTGFEIDLNSGSVVTVKARKTTCQRLPMGGSG